MQHPSTHTPATRTRRAKGTRRAKRTGHASLFVTLAALLLALLTACGSAAQSTAATADYAPMSSGKAAPSAARYEEEGLATPAHAYDEAEMAAVDGGANYAGSNGNAGTPTLTQPQDGRKIIMTAWVTLETQEFDNACENLQAKAAQMGGYVSSTSFEQNHPTRRTAILTLKIPAEQYSAFMQTIATIGNVTSRNETSEDVTQQYTDVEARLKSLEIQKSSLEELLAKAEAIEDLLQIQQQLSNVQYEIEYYTTNKRSLDNLTAYSTVEVAVYEVVQYTEQTVTYAEKIGAAFRQGLYAAGQFFQNLGLALAQGFVGILVVAALIILAIVLWRRHRKKRVSKPVFVPATPPGAPTPPTENAAPDATAPSDDPQGSTEK